MRRLAASLSVATLATLGLPAHGVVPVVGPRCTFLPDPTDLRSDVAAFVVTGGAVLVTEPSVTSVTVTCWVLVDGARAASVSATRDGSVGFVAGRTSVGTFTGPVVSGCTVISWTGGSSGTVSDCPDEA